MDVGKDDKCLCSLAYTSYMYKIYAKEYKNEDVTEVSRSSLFLKIKDSTADSNGN